MVAEVVCRVSDSYTIVLWCADTARFVSMVASHLLSEGLIVANNGRIDNDIPVAIGVANGRRWPIVSREVSARGIIRSRSPRIITTQRHDYLLTIGSGRHVDNAGAPPRVRESRVIPIAALVAALESVSPSQMSRGEVLGLFDGVAQVPIRGAAPHDVGKEGMHEVADICQRLVRSLER